MSAAPNSAATRWVRALALCVLAVGQLVAYLVLTGEPNPGIASTAVLPASAAVAVLLAGRARVEARPLVRLRAASLPGAGSLPGPGRSGRGCRGAA